MLLLLECWPRQGKTSAPAVHGSGKETVHGVHILLMHTFGSQFRCVLHLHLEFAAEELSLKPRCESIAKKDS
jgi:hypothetical protein